MGVLNPIGEFVLVQPAPDEEQATASGIVLMPSANKTRRGIVVGVGSGYVSDTREIPLRVKENDSVLFGIHAGQDLEVDGTEFVLLRESEIFGVLEN